MYFVEKLGCGIQATPRSLKVADQSVVLWLRQRQPRKQSNRDRMPLPVRTIDKGIHSMQGHFNSTEDQLLACGGVEDDLFAGVDLSVRQRPREDLLPLTTIRHDPEHQQGVLFADFWGQVEGEETDRFHVHRSFVLSKEHASTNGGSPPAWSDVSASMTHPSISVPI